MADAGKPRQGSGVSHEDGIDLSAGFVPKTPPAASEPSPRELTPDSFMAQQTNPAAVPAELTFDSFMAQEAPVATDGGEVGRINGKPISWRWCTEADMGVLQRLHFQAEIASGEAMYLPKAASNLRVIAVAERDGKVLGGIMSEDSIAVSLIGMDPAVVESAGEWMTQIFVAQAHKERTRFLQSSVPARLVARLDEALQKVGFKPLAGPSYQMDTGIEADEEDRRN